MRSTLLLAAVILLAPPVWAELPGFAPEEAHHFVAGPAQAHYLTPLERLERAAPGKNLDRISRLSNSLQMLVLEQTLHPNRAIDLDRFMVDGGHTYTTTWFQKDGLPVVDITVVGDVKLAIEELKARGAEVLASSEGSGYWLVGAAIPVNKLEDCMGATGVRAIHSSGAMTGRTFDEGSRSKAPQPDPHDGHAFSARGSRAQGAAVNQAEFALDIDDALRYFPSATGGGIDIGTLSDSANRISGIPNDGGLIGYAESQVTGDLPPNARINTVADNAAAGGLTDEGRAMMEHIYDLVPACSSYGFATAFFGGEAGFGANITALRNAGMNVINDDVVYFAEPYYQDGPVAQAVNAAVSAGRIYFALNHNYANNSYEGVYSDPDGDSWHEYNGANDELWRFTLNNGARVRAGLQWSQPWGNATTDMQFQLWNNNNPVTMIQADGTNNIGGNPIDFIDYTNTTGGVQTLNFAVRRLSGASAAGMTLKFVCFIGTALTPQEYPNDRAGTLTPHAGTPQSIAIGAARYDTPQTAEGFSGRGPHRRFFNANGTATGPFTYTKPDFMSVDGCDTTFFGGGDWDGTGFPNFFGTSAATPNAAAVAVMMLDAAGGPTSLNQGDVRTIMRLTAVDAGPVGHDVTYGFGRIMALGAVAGAAGPATTDIVHLYPNQFGDASHTGTFSSDTDRDSVRWAMDRAGSVTVDLSDPGTADPMFVLFNQTTGALIGADYNSGPGDDATLTYSGTTWSRYQADLYSEQPFASPNQEYTLSVNGLSPVVAAFPALDAFGDGPPVVGNINAPGDMDYYSVTAPATATGSVTIVLDPADTFDGMIFLFDNLGNELARRDSFFAGGTETLIYNSVSPGQQLVIGTAGYQHNSSGTFTMTVNFTNIPGQPNTFALPDFVQYVVRPNPITGLYTRLFRNIGEGDYDHGLFVPDGISSLTHSAATSNGTSITGGIYNEAGTRQAWDGENGDDTGFTVNAATPSFQQYRLTTYGADDSTRGTGILFSSTATEDPPPGPDGLLQFMASNGTWSAPGQLIDIFGDVDYYRLVTPYNATGPMTVTLDGTTTLQGQWNAFNAAGTYLGGAFANVDGGVAESSFNVQPRTIYYISAHGNANFNVNRTQANQVGGFSLGASVLLVAPDGGDDDGDGFRNDFEQAAGTNPNDAASKPGLGDSNNDGVTNMWDALHLMRRLPLSTYDPKLDVDLSGTVTAADATAIFNWSTKRAGYEVLPLVP